MKKTIFLSILIIALFIFNSCNQNLSKNWFKAVNKPKNYQIKLDNLITQNRERSVFIASIKTNGFGTLMQTCSTFKYCGKKIKITGFIKTENVVS